MSNPVQIILNPKNFVQTIKRPPGGSNTDFFEGRDNDFIKHKEKLDNSISNIIEKSKFNYEQLVYTNITLQDAGWAKSHRPTTQLFSEKNVQNVMGGNQLGEIIVELTVDELENIREIISRAPEKTILEKKDGKLKAKVSVLRSEVSVIDEIRLYDSVDKRNFTINQSIEWLAKTGTGHSYYIETFIDFNNQTTAERKSLSTCIQRVQQIYPDVKISYIAESWLNSIFIILKFSNITDIENIKKHKQLLKTLEDSPVIRTICLPPIVQSSQNISQTTLNAKLPSPLEGKSYPVIGVIDTGITDNPIIENWVAGRADFLTRSQQDLSHGTFIGGLIVGSKHFNNESLLDENNCKIYDLDLLPTTNDFEDYYPKGFIDLLQLLDELIPKAKANGVRIFNMSLNLLNCVEDNRYSIFANIIDNLSRKHDVIFVLSAGNLNPGIMRDEWPENSTDTLKMLAEYRHQGQDRVYQPAESIQSISVGAIDPERSSKNLRPSQYTRRGPGVSFGQKPDLVHIGGSYATPHNLASIDPNGNLAHGCGTSYAAPLVAKTLANLDHAIPNYTKSETLKALLIHHAIKPEWSNKDNMRVVGNDFLGFGIPQKASASLETSDHEITMVFESEIAKNQKLIFDFSWPQSLMNEKGGIDGDLNITLIYSPGIDRLNGAEFILHTLDVWLRQEKFSPKNQKYTYGNILKSAGSGFCVEEKVRIKHGSKWCPVRKIEQKFENEGNSSACKLVIEPGFRAGYEIIEPIPFTIILTISDKSKTHDIFNEVKAQLNANGVSVADIRSNIQSRLRP